MTTQENQGGEIAMIDLGSKQTRVAVTGAAGFIGGHLVKYLRAKGYWVRGIDIRSPEFWSIADADEFCLCDLRDWPEALKAFEGIEEVYGLAADMGGIGFITHDKASIVRNNTLINLHSIDAARLNRVKRYLFTSSACAYPIYRQTQPDAPALKEEEVWPAQPEKGYGEEKLFMERICEYYWEDYGLETRIVRFHNTFGPYGTWEGGREKSPAALCRKVAEAKDGDTIEIWGDGKQTRSYNYIDDCVEGVYRLMRSDYRDPLNLGSDRMVSIDELADIIVAISGKQIHKSYNLDAPQGVRGRNSDNTRSAEVLKWEPKVRLEDGLSRTYEWIAKQVEKKRAAHCA